MSEKELTFEEVWDKAINSDFMTEPWLVHVHLKQGVVLEFKAATHDDIEDEREKALEAFYERGEGNWYILPEYEGK